MVNWVKKNYHWVIAAVALLQLFFHSGAGNNFSNLHLIPVSEHLEISRTQFSVAYSTKNLMATFFTFVSGGIIARMGYKRAAGFGMLMAAAMYFLLTQMNAYPLLFVYCGGIGITNALCSTSAVTNIISAWFHKHKGLVLGTVSAATGLGGSVLCLVQTAAMEHFHTWKASFAVCGIGILLGGALIFLFVRNSPAEMGLRPYGDGEEIVGKRKKISQNAKEGLSIKALFFRPSFYIMILFTFLSCVCVYISFLVTIPFFTERGFSPGECSLLNSYQLLILAAFKFLMGWLSDRIGPRKITALCLLCVSLGLISLCFATSFLSSFIALTIFAAGVPLITVTVPLLAFDLFGYKSQPQYTGIFMGMISAASMVTGIFANFLFDAFQTYRYGFFAAAALALILIPAYGILYRAADRDPVCDPK